MNTWCSKVDVNFNVNYLDTSSDSTARVDGINLVSNEETQSSAGIAGLVYSNIVDTIISQFYVEPCQNGGGLVFKEIDFKVSNQGLNLTMERLTAVFLHEIGHIYMLSHSRKPEITTAPNDQPVMFHDLTGVSGIRSIKSIDEDGAVQLVSNSAVAMGGCGFSPITGGGCNDSCLSTSVEDYFISGIELFPNPSSGEINIEGKENNLNGSNLKIYTFSGQIVYEHFVESDVSSLKFQLDLDSGIYVVEIINSELGYWAQKITIE